MPRSRQADPPRTLGATLPALAFSGSDDLVLLGAVLDDRATPVEFLRTGTFTDKNGRTLEITPELLDTLVAHFHEGKAQQDVPIDIQHERAEAAGWLKDVWRQGDKLLALPDWTTLGQRLVGDKIYRYLSATIDLTGKVLKSISLVNFPAVKGLAAVELSEYALAAAESLDAQIQTVRSAFVKGYARTDEYGGIQPTDPYPIEIFADYLVAGAMEGGDFVYRKVAYTRDDTGAVVFAPRAEWSRVKQVWTEAGEPAGFEVLEAAEAPAADATPVDNAGTAVQLSNSAPATPVAPDAPAQATPTQDAELAGSAPQAQATQISMEATPMPENVTPVEPVATPAPVETPALAQLSEADKKALIETAKTELMAQFGDEWKAARAAMFAEALAEVRLEAELSEFAKKVTTTGAHALPVQADTLQATLKSLPQAQREAVMGILSAIFDGGTVDFSERGTAAPAPETGKKLDSGMASVLRSHLAKGGKIEVFFADNADLLGPQSAYDLSEFGA